MPTAPQSSHGQYWKVEKSSTLSSYWYLW